MNRRELLRGVSTGSALLALGNTGERTQGQSTVASAPADGRKQYKYRIAFGAWINDMRDDPLPLENWPAPQFDDETIDSAIRAMDVQAPAGFNMLDAWGLFATYGWPPDIRSVMTDERRARITRLLKAARARNIRPILGMGTYSWGYDKIIESDPAVRGKNPDGTPHAHAMCGASDKSFEYVKRILDFTLGEFDFAGVHLESCDLGCCWCPQCAGKDGVVGYNVRINARTADYIRSKWPDKIIYSITINWCPPGKHFSAEEKAHLVELSRHVDCIFDQGHNGYHIDEAEREAFIRTLHCAYGTSGQLWLYPDARWDRSSYFLPYPRRSSESLRKQYVQGVRGCMFYQGPVSNPGTELMMAVGGRMLNDIDRNVDDVLGEVLSTLYRPDGADTLKRLQRIVQVAEESYFSQWSSEAFTKIWGIPKPGEFKLDQRLFGTTPGPATYLKEPCLDVKGRVEYRKGLVSILSELPGLASRCRDDGRLMRIRRAAIVTLNLLNTISYCMGETIPT